MWEIYHFKGENMAEGSKCWNCGRLGGCENISPTIINCNDFLSYENIKINTTKLYKYCNGKNQRSVFRNLENIREIMTNLEKINKTKYCLFLDNDNKTIICDVRFLKRFIDYEEI